MAKKIITFITLIGLTVFYRFYKLHTFQYWSDDEQLIWFIIRHIVVDHHLSLVVPNAALGIGLGPLFHYLLTPWFWLVRFDPEKILLLGNLWSIPNLIAIYFAGRTITDKKVGVIAALLYSTSFIAAIFDRRVWALTPNILLISLSIIALTQIVRGNSKYLILLVFPIVFSFNSDPSLALTVPAFLLTLIIFRPHIQFKHLALSIILGAVLLSPLIIFDIRHNGQNINSLINHTATQIQKSTANSRDNFILQQINNTALLIFPKSTSNADAYFCYCTLDNTQSLVRIAGAAIFLIAFSVLAIKKKSKTNIILLIIYISYFGGILIFGHFLNGFPAFFYSITILPVVFLMIAILLASSKKLSLVFLIFYLVVNTNTLLKSEFKYPLSKRMDLVRKTIENLPVNQPFSLYYSGDILLASGGWTALFASQSALPTKGSLSLYWGHIYKSYQIYPIPFSSQEPETVVVMSEKLGSIKVSHMSADIYSNKSGQFNPTTNLEKLYQPIYFK